MGKLHIIQLLCRARHCILAATYFPGKDKREKIEGQIRGKLKELEGEWKCGVCGDVHLSFESKSTRFDSHAEATPLLALLQIENLRSRMLIDSTKANREN